MSNDIAIRIEGLGKCYQLGQTVDLTRTFRETLQTLPQFFARKAVRSARKLAAGAGRANMAKMPKSVSNPRIEGNNFWALRDINLEIKKGAAVGIIGRNGAGKSTLLKILSRITAPTRGRVELHGRVGALLEVGTGFHSELTGRENIYLNGAILGMAKQEIRSKFDEIVDFAGIGDHLDTPVKRYSSGMRVRLGFAVAAHLETDILIVDEVLSVGDAEFRHKCIGKMEDIATGGRTVIFVSHSMGAMAQLCHEAFWLDSGSMLRHGPAREIIDAYLTSTAAFKNRLEWPSGLANPGVKDFHFRSVEISQQGSGDSGTLEYESEISVQLIYELSHAFDRFRVGFQVSYGDGTPVFYTFNLDDPKADRKRTAGVHVSKCTIPDHFLNAGRYYVSVFADVPGDRYLCKSENLLSFQVEVTQSTTVELVRPGVIRPRLDWKEGADISLIVPNSESSQTVENAVQTNAS